MSVLLPQPINMRQFFLTHQHKFIALLLAASLTSAVVILLGVAVTFNSDSPPRYEVRTIDSATIEPPPPPAQQQQAEQESKLKLDVSGSGPALEYTPQVNTPLANFTPPDNLNPDISRQPIKLPEINWQGFSLSELDGIPQLLSTVSLDVPADLKRRLGNTILLRLEVSINSQGKVTLLRIVESPAPKLRFSIEQMVKKSEFTPPKRNGKTVKARFIWPLEVEI